MDSAKLPTPREGANQSMNARESFHSGDLQGAIAAASDEVKRHPTQTSALRPAGGGLLCFTGELDRADKHLDAVGQQDPEAMLGVAVQRQLLRAELARREFYEQGRVPEFLDQPPTHVRLALEASIAIREGNVAEAAPPSSTRPRGCVPICPARPTASRSTTSATWTT